MFQRKLSNHCLLGDIRSVIHGQRARCHSFPLIRTESSLSGISWVYKSQSRVFSSSGLLLRASHKSSHEQDESETGPQSRRQGRSPSGKTSLRRVAVEAQRSRDGKLLDKTWLKDAFPRSNRVRAYCAAEQYDIGAVIRILRKERCDIDPYKTGLLPQVVHIQIPIPRPSDIDTEHLLHQVFGDIFIFPSGTVVTWSLPTSTTSKLVNHTLVTAAQNSHVEDMETEDMEFVEDPQRENSSIRGDTIIVGTRPKAGEQDRDRGDASSSYSGSASSSATRNDGPENQGAKVDTILAKIAFSSGLARSTKLAVLESLLSNYFDSTRTIPTMLSRGSRLPFTRSFILRKTGQLLSVRAQLNLYSELTDSLPDLFWDSRHELGLEGYYDQVGRALDVGVRIKVLNEKMDYAQEIASVLRERLSEKHGLVLEWMIIALITIEVGFEVLRLWKEGKETAE